MRFFIFLSFSNATFSTIFVSIYSPNKFSSEVINLSFLFYCSRLDICASCDKSGKKYYGCSFFSFLGLWVMMIWCRWVFHYVGPVFFNVITWSTVGIRSVTLDRLYSCQMGPLSLFGKRMHLNVLGVGSIGMLLIYKWLLRITNTRVCLLQEKKKKKVQSSHVIFSKREMNSK